MSYKIAYVCERDPTDYGSNSGVHVFMIRALEKCGNEVIPYFPDSKIFNKILRIAYRFYSYSNRNSSMFYNSKLYASLLAHFFKWTKTIDWCDVVFVSRGSALLAFTDFGATPVIYTSDATFELMCGYNDNFKNVSANQIAEGNLLERLAILRSASVFYPSEWASASALKDYGAKPEKVAVIPSGANNGVYVEIDIEQLIAQRLSRNSCRLLFVGKSWSGKGGSIAVNALRILRTKGVDATLTIVGCRPENLYSDDSIEVVPEIDKNQPGGVEKLNELFEKANFFILPTRNETFGLVFAEACSFGLPIVATRTGGVPTSVVDGSNGFLFGEDDSGPGYAEKIASLWLDKETYVKFSLASRRRYEEVLNWDAWGRTVQKLITSSVRV